MKYHVLVVFLVLMLSGCVENQSVKSNFDVTFEYPKEVRCGTIFSIKARIQNNIGHPVNNFEIDVEEKYNSDIVEINCDGRKTETSCYFSRIDHGDEKEIVFNMRSPSHYCIAGSNQNQLLKIYPQISVSYDSADQSNLFIPIESGLLKGISSSKRTMTNGPVAVEIVLPEGKNYLSPGETIDVEFKFISDKSADVILKKQDVNIQLTNLKVYDSENCDFDSLRPKEDVKVNEFPLFCSFKADDKSGENAIISVNYKYSYKKLETFQISMTSSVKR
ncbi:MAG: hypothetical protein N3D75_03030 [Candidatus Aenigmarchaeota archaeon]|nr:hypothetical protein [Candidatus Aenigmarchaeota archaeon]